MLQVKHMMIKNVITANPNMSIKQTIKTLYEKHIGSVVAIDNNKKCIGIFTERDAIRLVAENTQLDQPLDKVMTKNIITIQEDASINEARKIITTHKVRHLPVVNKKSELTGLISVRAISDQFLGLNSQNC
jgi:CBS domain-containing protein